MTATMTYPKCSWSSGRVAQRTTPPLIAGETVDAISMPAAFGALVQAELGIMMLAGPVTADDDGSLIFLTQRAETPAVPADLLRLGVRAVPAGTPLEPGRSPAIWWTVIGASRRVAHRIGA